MKKKIFEEQDDMKVTKNVDGSLELFVKDLNGCVWHIWQQRDKGGWSEWEELGIPGKTEKTNSKPPISINMLSGVHESMKKKSTKALLESWFGVNEAFGNDPNDPFAEPKYPPSGQKPTRVTTPIGTAAPGVANKEIELSIGGKKMKFTADEFMEMASSGQFANLVGKKGGPAKLPGISPMGKPGLTKPSGQSK